MSIQRAIVEHGHLLNLAVRLPVPGKVLVHVGQAINYGDLIAEAVLPAKFQVFDVVNQFRINERDLEGCIKRLAGESVQKGDVIARKPGLISRIFRAPEAGKVVAVRDGRVTLAMGEKNIQSYSPISGTVADLIPGFGAQVVARGTSLQAAWGNGKFAMGNLTIVKKLDQSASDILKDKIVFLTGSPGIPELRILQDAQVAGVVFPSLDPRLFSACKTWKIPLISLVGFGEAQTDTVSRNTLEKMNEKQVFLLGHFPNAADGIRPELFLPDPGNQTAELFEATQLELVGNQVRLLGSPYFGSQGRIIEVSENEERLGSGLLSNVVVVKRDDEKLIHVPLENLEILSR